MGKPSLNLLAQSCEPDGAYPAKNDHANLGPLLKDSFFKSVQWSADGTTLITSSYANRVCSYVLPENLLEAREEPTDLKAQGTLVLPEASSAIAPCPYFALENPSTQAILTASTDHPIQLHYAFPSAPTEDESASPFRQPPPLASFNLIKRETEAYLPIASLIWPTPGTHFIAGTTNRIALFDVSRPDAMNAEPLLSIPTIPSTRHISKGNGIGMRGTVSALAAQVREHGDAGLIAAGTWTRNMGLYDLQRAGDCVATWSVAGVAAETGINGKGIVQTVWSPCGRYLVVNERGASGLLAYDLRGTNRLLAYLNGREGNTNQRLSCDVFPGTNAVGGFEVWAGDQNGEIAVWEGVGNEGGAVLPSWNWQAHQCAVGSTAMHMSGSVIATCSGAWKAVDNCSTDSDSSGSDSSNSDSSNSDSSDASTDSDDSTSGSSRSSAFPFVVEETSLKVWSIGPSSSPASDAENGP